MSDHRVYHTFNPTIMLALCPEITACLLARVPLNMQLYHHAWMLMPPTAILSVLTFTAYFVYRIYCLVKAQEIVEPSSALGLAWFFLAVEFLIFGTYPIRLNMSKQAHNAMHSTYTATCLTEEYRLEATSETATPSFLDST